MSPSPSSDLPDPPAGRVTMSDVARAAGVHKSTVSLALRAQAKIPPATRSRILEAAARIGYRPDPLLDAFNSHRLSVRPSPGRPAVAFVVDQPDHTSVLASSLHREALAGARHHLQTLGYALALFFLGHGGLSPARLNHVLEARGITAVILAAFGPGSDLTLPWEHYSIVAIDTLHAKAPLSRITLDYRQAARRATRRLREAGARRVGFLASVREMERLLYTPLAGYLLERAETDPLPPLIMPAGAEADPRSRLDAWIRLHRPDAIVAGCAEMEKLVQASGLLPAHVRWSGLASAGVQPFHAYWLAGAMAAELLQISLQGRITGLTGQRSTLVLPFEPAAPTASAHQGPPARPAAPDSSAHPEPATPARPVTLRDVARAAGAHLSTVCLALNGSPKVAASTRARVQHLARELGYRPDDVMRALTLRRLKLPRRLPLISFLTNRRSEAEVLASAHMAAFLAGARERATSLGFDFELVLIHEASGSDGEIEAGLRARGTRAIILAAILPHQRQVRLDWADYVTVKIDSSFVPVAAMRVAHDQRQIVQTAYNELRARGRQRIGLAVGRYDEDGSDSLFRSGYLLAAHERGDAALTPLLFGYTDSTAAISAQLRAWVQEQRLDAVISNWGNIEQLLEAAGFTGEERVPCACLCLPAPDGRLAGVMLDNRTVGQKAVEMIALQLKCPEVAAAAAASCLYVEGEWRDGTSV